LMKSFTKSAERPAAIADKAAARETEFAGTTNVVVATVLDSANHRMASAHRCTAKLVHSCKELIYNSMSWCVF